MTVRAIAPKHAKVEPGEIYPVTQVFPKGFAILVEKKDKEGNVTDSFECFIDADTCEIVDRNGKYAV